MKNQGRKGMLGKLIQQVRAWIGGTGNRRKLLADPLKMATAAATTATLSSPPQVSPVPDQERHARIAGRSRALAMRLFGANQPVNNPRDLFGRARELDLLSTSILDGGMHAVIHGPRGSGKTSLVRVFGDLADERGATVIYQSCAGGTGFSDLMQAYLDDFDAAMFGIGKEDFARALAAAQAIPTPRSFASLLVRAQHSDLILILDEFDRLDADTKGQLALLVKLLSDMRSRVRLVFVGISGDVSELIEVHASVRRHLVPVGLSRLDDKEVENFITTTSRAIGLTVLQPALSLLRWLVCGSPYHMRLFSLHTCLYAIEKDRNQADEAMVLAGLERALAIWRGTNARDHALFDDLVTRSGFSCTSIEAVARLAATRLEFTVDDIGEVLGGGEAGHRAAPSMIAELTPALGRLDDGSQRLVFDDVLAPQFLLAICATTRLNKMRDNPVREGDLQ